VKCAIIVKICSLEDGGLNGQLQVVLENLNKNEALRYMGYGDISPDENILSLMNECEKALLAVIKPCCVYHVFDIEEVGEGVAVCGTSLVLKGDAIREHLAGCCKVVLMAATLSAHADRVIRRYEATDMTRAVMADFLASAAVEQVCDAAEESIGDEFSILSYMAVLSGLRRLTAGYPGQFSRCFAGTEAYRAECHRKQYPYAEKIRYGGDRS